MFTKSNKSTFLLFTTLTIVALVVGTGNYLRHLQQLRTEIENTFLSRSSLLSKFVELHRNQVSVMRNSMLERYRANDSVLANNLEFRELPAQKVWELVSRTEVGGLTGRASLPLDADIRREIWAALGIDAQVYAAQEFDPEVVWLYYQSAKGFLYLAPHVTTNSFHFDEGIYQQRYWQEASPEVNKDRRMILAGPYQDQAGKGWVLTFALPVYDGDNFLGITALDLQIDTLQNITNIGQATGESMMISENDRLITKQSGFEPEKVLHPSLSENPIDWRKDKEGVLWLSSPVVQDELWLVHRVTSGKLYLAAARETLATWFMILLLGLLGLILHRLQSLFAQLARMSYTDPLTQALNRRGFHEKVVASIAQSERQHLGLAVLIMDIDFFKKVNDAYGHAEGDSVLKQLGGYLLKASRPFDLVCRWGGEEFVLVMPLEHVEDAANVAERMRQEAQRTRIQPVDLPITLSGGLVLLKDGEQIDDAIKRADILLYQAKDSGRNKIMIDL